MCKRECMLVLKLYLKNVLNHIWYICTKWSGIKYPTWVDMPLKQTKRKFFKRYRQTYHEMEYIEFSNFYKIILLEYNFKKLFFKNVFFFFLCVKIWLYASLTIPTRSFVYSKDQYVLNGSFMNGISLGGHPIQSGILLGVRYLVTSQHDLSVFVPPVKKGFFL